MEIIKVKLKDIKPYEKNAKLHPKEQIEQIKQSILEFDNNDPIAIDENNVIIEGHGRYQALKELGYKEVECIRLSHLTDEQKKAYMLVHNKLTMNSDFDYDILNLELDDILNIDMEQYGFELDYNYDNDIDDDETYSRGYMDDQNANVRSVYMYNLDLFDETKVTGKYQMPIIKPTNHIPKDFLPFHWVNSNRETTKDVCISFYIDDYRFGRIWNNPTKYLEILSRFDSVLMPDFSQYNDMPYSMKMWNNFKSKLLAQWWQDNGIEVIPIVQFSTRDTLEWSFDGIPENSVISLSVQSVPKDKEGFEYWKEVMNLFIDTKKPKMLLLHGNETSLDFDFRVPTKYYRNKTLEIWSKDDEVKNG